MKQPTRPVLRWHGGKWLLAPWIISHFPPHRIYTEAFGGGCSVLLRKPRAYAEVYNDLDAEVVNLFRVLQKPRGSKILTDKLRLTPFARVEFEGAYRKTSDPIESARRLIIRSFMGFGSNSHNDRLVSGFRSASNRLGKTPAHDWRNYPEHLKLLIERFRGVVVEKRPGINVILQHDGPETLHYVDPPYLHSTRTDNRHDYKFEMTEKDHSDLAGVLRSVKGMVVLSGYRSEFYDELYSDWRRTEKKCFADGAKPRLECLWLNQKTQEKIRSLF